MQYFLKNKPLQLGSIDKPFQYPPILRVLLRTLYMLGNSILSVLFPRLLRQYTGWPDVISVCYPC